MYGLLSRLGEGGLERRKGGRNVTRGEAWLDGNSSGSRKGGGGGVITHSCFFGKRGKKTLGILKKSLIILYGGREERYEERNFMLFNMFYSRKRQYY